MLEEQREKDRQDRENEEKEQQEVQMRNLKQPHITNLNEDSLLTGQLYYSLANLAEQDIHVGRSDGNPTPKIIFRGIGIQPNHAYFSINKQGEISLCVNSLESFEQTLVNGARLNICENELLPGETFKATVIMNHLDRICFGSGALF